MALHWPVRHRGTVPARAGEPWPVAAPSSGPSFFDDQSPYADRLTLTDSFGSDDETRATAQDLRTYSRLSWHRDWFGVPRPRH